MGHQVNEADIWHQSALYFAHVADSLSHGHIEVRVFANEQLGPELDMLRSIKAGVADLTISGESMQTYSPIAMLCGTPYLIRDHEHLKEVVDGPIGREIADRLTRKVGLRPIAWFARGPRYLTSNRPIRTPDDLNGIIIRVPPVPLSVKTWEALGAKPTPMTFSEVFTALQQGTIEAQENPLAFIYSGGLYEVQHYVNLTGHVIGWIYVLIGEKKFESLSAEDQAIILKAGRAMQTYEEQRFLNEEIILRKELERKGMQFIAVDQDAFRRKASAAVAANIPESIRPLYEEIKQLP